MNIQAPKGTKDALPKNTWKWQYLESMIRQLTAEYGYKEIRTPTFERTELFERGVGDTTDIVQKEMYTFNDKGGRSMTLKPEGTAGVVRAYIQNKLYADPQPVKSYYITPIFRYERPQAGRFREHHQFGVEVFGAPLASVDAEIISLATTLFTRLGLSGLEANINSIGCPECRPGYHKLLKEYFSDKVDDLCSTCRGRLETNPLRVLDCKVPSCQVIVADAPKSKDHLCKDCADHFESLKSYLEISGINYVVNPLIVRGLDYYTKTVFEIISHDIGSQGTICGGGRYDGLVKECGGPDTPGIGFGMGLERVLMVLDSLNIDIPEPDLYDVCIVPLGDDARLKAFEMITDMRNQGVKADTDHVGRGIKAQMRYAGKLKYKIVCVLGDDEMEKGVINAKIMADGNQKSIPIEQLADFVIKNK